MTDQQITIDLEQLTVNDLALGAPVNGADWLSRLLTSEGMARDDSAGYAITAESDELVSAFITVADFQGQFVRNGAPVAITESMTADEIVSMFGPPYWRDNSDGEIILFYEFADGQVELQFEFPESANLAYMTLMRNGVLSDPAERSAYGVDKPWPPAQG